MSQSALKVKDQDLAEARGGSAPKEWNKRIIIVDDEVEIANSYVQILNSQSNVTSISRSSRSAKTSTIPPKAPETANESENRFSQYEIVVTHSAQDALLKIRNATAEGKPFALGFFDVRLGEGMDGIELVKEAHKIDPEIYSVFVTAYQDRGVDTIGSYLGKEKTDRWDYLTKPFSEGEIIQKARNYTALWNLRKEKEQRDVELAEAHKRLQDGERLNSVAVVARGVAHEFGNILMQIVGTAELNIDRPEQELRKALENILKASDVATNVLNRFKFLGSKEEHVKREMIWAAHPLEESLQLMDHQIKLTKTKVCRIKTDKIQVKAAASSLVQVFVNIIINALHAMGNGGQIDFSVTEIGNWVEVKIRDYGPGIPKEHLEKIMSPFFTTKGTKGTGLGLAISREIIEIEHAGKIIVQNNPHKGAEFIIRLPLNDSAMEEE